MKELSAFEKKYITCEVCGGKTTTPKGLGIHKSRKGCWDLPMNVDLVNSIDPSFVPKPGEDVVEVIKHEVQDVVIENKDTNQIIPEVTITTVESLDKPEVKPEVKPELESNPNINPRSLGVTEVPIGAQLQLKDTLFFIGDQGNYLSEFLSNPVVGYVIRRWADSDGSMWLDVKTTDKTYVLRELYVLPDNVAIPPIIRILSLRGASDDIKNSFKNSLSLYIKARDEKAKAEAVYNEVNKEQRPIIIGYVEKYGQASAPDQKDNVILEDGIKVLWSYRDVPPITKRKDNEIISYLLKNKLMTALDVQYVLKEDEYQKLKETGMIPEEFINSVETTEYPKPKRQLYVTEIK
jgi:hypothetical protein